MNCSCRTAALRIFVRSVVRVHAPPLTSTTTRGTRSCQTLSQQPFRYGRRNGLASPACPVSSRRRMSSAAPLSDDTTSGGEPANVTTSAAPDEGKHDDDAASPRFPKALKAKKKQKRLVEKVTEDLLEAEQLVYDTKAALEQGQVEQVAPEEVPAETAKEESEAPTGTQDEEAENLVEKIPKNRRKREARQAGTYVPGESPPQNAEKPTEEKPPKRERKKLLGEDNKSRNKPQAKDSKARNTEKVERPKRDARQARDSDNTTEPPPRKEPWQLQKAALKEKFPEGWSPRKRLSPDALAGIKALHQQFPEEYTTDVLADKFEVSPEAIRRILKSKWEPAPEEEIERQERWFSRGKRIWSAWADEGKKPPTKWRKEGITRDPSFHERRARSIAQRKLAKTLM
ncbi:hypothetical protein GE09DRAFT_1073009 [Coniochaeta sp. 2T2.1]|nr:hypothetical protein GE09DRAFT_1073009 [Coniochaeta sp. 2T2.1]